MARLFLLVAMLFGFVVATPTANAVPDCTHVNAGGCTVEWYNDPVYPGQGLTITTCGDWREIRYGPGGPCGPNQP